MVWKVWQRAPLGLKLLPYQVVQGMIVAGELIKGASGDPTDPYMGCGADELAWFERVCPYSTFWVLKICLDGNIIARDTFIFVDDLRVTSPTKKECWGAVQRAARLLITWVFKTLLKRGAIRPRQLDPG